VKKACVSKFLKKSEVTKRKPSMGEKDKTVRSYCLSGAIPIKKRKRREKSTEEVGRGGRKGKKRHHRVLRKRAISGHLRTKSGGGWEGRTIGKG